MTLDTKVLFACTGNRFRSMAAEYCLRKYLEDNCITGMIVGSVGTSVHSNEIHYAVKKELGELGIDISSHVPTQLTTDVIPKPGSGVLVAMAVEHKKFLEENYGVGVPLYKEILEGKSESVLDIDDAVEDFKNNLLGCEKHIKEVILYLYRSAPDFYTGVHRYISEAQLSPAHSGPLPQGDILESTAFHDCGSP